MSNVWLVGEELCLVTIDLLNRLDGHLGLAVYRSEGADRRWLKEAEQYITEIRKVVRMCSRGGRVSVERKRTARGFAIYEELQDAYGADVSVIQSSSAEDDYVWLFIDGGAVGDNDGSAHLNKDMAVRVRDALNAWLLEVDK